MSAAEIVAVVLAFAAVLLRGLLAAAETAVASTGRSEAVEMAESGLWGAKWLVRLKDAGERATSAIRAMQLVLLALAAAVAGWAGAAVIGPRLNWAALGLTGTGGAIISALVGGFLVAALAFFLGDLMPRSWAAARPKGTARLLAVPVLMAVWLMGPLVGADRWVTHRLMPALGLPVGRGRPPPPLEDLERYLADHAARGTVSSVAPELVHSIFEFGETRAKEVMVPRTQVVALEVGAPAKEIQNTITSKGHTRLPVYEEKIDNIIGIVNAKDILPLLTEGEPIELRKILRRALFVPWSKPINQLMRELQVKHVHMAMVVDEFGGLMGLITLEDILEEIVGEIEDEFDPVDSREVEALPDGSYLVRATIDIGEFNEAFGSSISDEEPYETLAGFLNSLAGTIPKEGDTFLHNGLQLMVAKRSERRIRQVRVRKVRA